MIDFLKLAYPFLVFVFIRAAIIVFGKWSIDPKLHWVILGIVLSALTFDTGARLMAIAVLAPYWWLPYLVGFALLYVAYISIRNTWRKIPHLLANKSSSSTSSATQETQ